MRQFRLALVAASLSGILGHSAHAAVYDVIELPMQDIALNSFSSSINDSGNIALISTGVYNPPIDLSLLDFDSETFTENLTDIDAARNGDFNDEDLLFITSFIEGQIGNTGQQLAVSQSYLVNAGATNSDDVTFIAGFDEISDDFNGYTRSTDTRIREINNQGVLVGSSEAVFEKVEYTNESDLDITYIVQPFGQRAFVNIDGVNYGIAPESEITGAITEGFDVNNNLLVAGYESVDPTETRQTAHENCQDDETRADIPLELCYQQLIDAGVLTAFQLRGALWQLNADGEVLSKETLGLLITPEEDDTTVYISRALAVNDAGIAVGEATDYYRDDEDQPRTFAAIFNDGEVTGFTDHDEFFNSIATDINNNNLAVGQSSKNINGTTRTKFFVYDVDSATVTYPTDFFEGSASVARAINDNNLVVGEGEVDASFNLARRKHAFLYDIEEDNFQDLNDLIACDSPYTIVQANSINNSNQIAATAVVNRQTFNIKGEPRVDDNGDPVTDDLIVSLLLNPIPNGEIEDCSTGGDTPPDEAPNEERSSGSFGIFASLGLGLLAFLRRRVTR